jgi:hypothetical protein
MYFLRQPAFPLVLEYKDLTADQKYLLEIYSDDSQLLYSFDVEANEFGKIYKELPRYFERFDAKYSVYLYSVDQDGKALSTEVSGTLTINRPYINPIEISENQEEIDKNSYNERVARAIIDSITGGFYYKDRTIELVGLGGDFLSVPDRINKINFVYRNNVKVFDAFAGTDVIQDRYVITPDNSAITIAKSGLYNRHQSAPQTLPLAASDSFNLYSDSDDPIAALTKIREFDLFPRDYDYVLTGEFGWPVVPQDIQDATRMLINDLSCNKLQYVSQYIKEYKTDQFTIKYDDFSSRGTGNMLVDKILSQYNNNFQRMGVL